MKILVTGATGQLGGKIVDFLMEKVSRDSIVVGVRNIDSEQAINLSKKGLEVRRADFNDRKSLESAFKNIEKVFIVSTGTVEEVPHQQVNIIAAAKSNSIKLIVYSSAPRADQSDFVLAAPHMIREKMIKESGVPYVFLRNNWYIENELATVESVIHGAPWLTSAGEGKVGWVLRSDLAEATANILAETGHENKIYELGGESLTQEEFVDSLKKIIAKDITVMQVDDQTYLSMLKQTEIPDELANLLTMIQKGIREGGLENTSKDLELLLGRKPHDISTALKILIGIATNR